MAKFDPLEFGYYLYSDNNEILNYQKEIVQQDVTMIDVMELVHFTKPDAWAIVIKVDNLKQFIPNIYMLDANHMTLFMGKIKNDFDFRFLISKIIKDPQILIQMGA